MSKNHTISEQTDDATHTGYLSKGVREVTEAEGEEDFFDRGNCEEAHFLEDKGGHEPTGKSNTQRTKSQNHELQEDCER